MLDVEKIIQKHDELWTEIHKDRVYNLYSKYEDVMKKTKQNQIPITPIAVGIIAVTIVIGILTNNIIAALGILVAFTVLIMLLALPIAKKYAPNMERYREELIPQLLESTDFIKKVNKPGNGISMEEYKNIGFADGNFNEFYSNYNIVTLCDEQEIKISNIKIKYYDEEIDVYTDTDTNTNSSANINTKRITDVTRFEGILMTTKFDKNILDGYIHIFTDKRENSKYSNKEDKISIDSTEFENKFDVYASDKVKALMILTSDVMMKILEKAEEKDVKIEIAISNNILAIRIPDIQPRFTGIHINGENKLLRENVIEDIQYIYDLNKFIRKIIEAINDTI